MARLSLYTTAAALAALTGVAMAAEPTLRGGAARALAPVTDTFAAPKVNGVRVDWCYGYDGRMGPNNPNAFLGCGQDSANAYCKAVGYDSAQSFVKDEQISEPTIYLLQMSNNPAPLHDAFKSITCTKADGGAPSVTPPQPPVTPPPVKPDPNPTVPATQETWRYPRISSDGPRLDWCAAYDTRVGQGTNNPAGFIGCGQQAADLYCKRVGYEKAVRFEKDANITEPTMYILQSVVNPNPTHDAFSYITCGK